MTSREPVENKGSKRRNGMHWNGLPVSVRLVRVLDLSQEGREQATW